MNILLSSITFLFILFTSIFALPSSNLIHRQLGQFQPCKTKVYPVQITKLTYTPNPIVIGQVLQVDIAGTTQVPIEQNTILQIQGIVVVPIVTYKSDFCKEIMSASTQPCPIPAGDFNFQISIVVPQRPELSKLNGVKVRNTRKYFFSQKYLFYS